MLNFHLIFFQSVQQLLFDIRPIDVNRLFNRNLHWYLAVDIHWNFTIDVDWLVHIYDFFRDCGNFHCLYYLLLDLKRNFLLDFHVFRYLYNFLDDSFRAWNGLRHLHNNLDRFLYNHLLDNLFGNNTFVSFNFCVSVFQEFPHHIQLNFQLVFFTLKSIKFLFEIIRFFIDILIVLELELKPNPLSLRLLKVLLKFMNFLE